MPEKVKKLPPIADNEADRLAALRDFEVLDTGPERALDDLVQLASQICGTPIALISLVDENRQWFKARVGVKVSETHRDEAFCAHAIQESDVFVVEDALKDPRFAENALVTGPMKVRFYAGAQLKTSDGFNIGALCVISSEPRQLSEIQRTSLEALARQVIVNFEGRRNKRLAEKRERFLANFVSMLPDLVGYVDQKYIYRYGNAAYEQWFNVKPETLVGKTMSQVIGEAAFAIAKPYIDSALRGEHQEYENQLPYVINGEVHKKFVRVHYIPDFNDQKEVVGVFAVVSDISKLKQAESNALQQSHWFEMALRQSQQSEMSFRALYEHSPVGMLQLNSKYQIVSSNPAFQKMLGMSAQELEMKSVVDLTVPEDVERTKAQLKKNLTGVVLQGFEKRYLHKDGKVVWVRITSQTVQFNENEEVFHFSVLEDITEQVARQAELEQERLKSIKNAKLASLGELSAGVAHEINNPLAIISAAMTVLPKFREDVEKFENKISMVNRSVARISKIVNGLRRFSRSNEGTLMEDKVLADIVNEAMVILESRAKHAAVSVTVEISSHAKIHCNEIEIEQVLVNLANNAIDAVKDLPEKWVKIILFEKEKELVLRVKDSGPGLSIEVKNKLFQPFFTTKPIGEGTGLGLSITKGILDQHKASISINEEEPHTCFEVRFLKATEDH